MTWQLGFKLTGPYWSHYHTKPSLRSPLVGPSQPLMLPPTEAQYEEQEITQGPITLAVLLSLNPYTHMVSHIIIH